MLLKLLGTVAEQGGSIAVRIGHENPYAGLQTTSMVTTGYGAGSRPRRGPRRASARPGWTTPRRWPPCAPSRPTSRGSSPSTGISPHRERLLRRPRRRPRRHRGGHQARLPQVRPALPPRRQPGPGGRGAVQEALPGLRRAVRPGQEAGLRPRLRPLRLRAPPASARASRSATSWTPSSAARRARAGRGPRSRHHPRPGRPGAPRHRPRRRRVRRAEGPHHRHRGGLLHLPRRRACSRAPRPAPATCAPAGARSSRCSAASSAR